MTRHTDWLHPTDRMGSVLRPLTVCWWPYVHFSLIQRGHVSMQLCSLAHLQEANACVMHLYMKAFKCFTTILCFSLEKWESHFIVYTKCRWKCNKEKKHTTSVTVATLNALAERWVKKVISVISAPEKKYSGVWYFRSVENCPDKTLKHAKQTGPVQF